MGDDREVGVGLGVIMLGVMVTVSIYFMVTVVERQDGYFYDFVYAIDKAIDDAYGAAIREEQK